MTISNSKLLVYQRVTCFFMDFFHQYLHFVRGSYLSQGEPLGEARRCDADAVGCVTRRRRFEGVLGPMAAVQLDYSQYLGFMGVISIVLGVISIASPDTPFL